MNATMISSASTHTSHKSKLIIYRREGRGGEESSADPCLIKEQFVAGETKWLGVGWDGMPRHV